MVMFDQVRTILTLASQGAGMTHIAAHVPLSWLSDLFFWLFMAIIGLLYVLVYVAMAVVAWLLLVGVLVVIGWPLGWLYEKLTEAPTRATQVNPYEQIDRLSHDYVDAAARLLQRR